jgi:tetrahydromethanopterin S-methyltransferase subunit D
LQGIEGVTIDPKSVTITATDEALPKLREIEGVTINDKTMTVTAETADALRALQGIEGVTIVPKAIEVNANTSEAQQKIDELKAKIAELEDKNINIKAFVDNVSKPLGDQQLSNTPGTLLKAPDATIPSGGLQLDDKAMKSVQKNIDKQMKDVGKIGDEWSGVASAIGAVGNAMAGIEDPAAKVLGIVAQAIATVALTFSKSLAGTVTPWDWIAAAAAGTATMISTISAIHSATGFANGGVVPGFANGGVIDSGHSPSFLSFSKAAPAFATGGVVPQTITSMPKFATGGIIQKFNEGGTVEAGHAPDFLSFSKSMPKFATGGIIQKFNEGGTVEASHAPDFLSFSKAMPKFATGGTIPHANNGYFVGGTHYSSDVTPIMANAGELVLNKAQQATLAQNLQGGGMQNLNLTATIKGEQIRLALNNNGRRTGRGEYVQSRNVR